MIYVCLLGLLAALGHLIIGFMSGSMAAMGAVFATARKNGQPRRYWFFAFYNFVLLAGFVALLIAETKT